MVRLAFAAIAVLALAASDSTDPRLIRVRLVVTTTSTGVDVNIEGATLASYTSAVLTGGSQVHASSTGHTLGLGRNVRGQTAEARFDVIIARVAGTAVTWNVTTDSPGHTALEVYAVPSLDRPALVDRFTLDDAAARFNSSASLLDAGAHLQLDRVRPRLMLAHFYPWYTDATWNDDQLADRPLRRYSTDRSDDVRAVAAQARAAGIDAFVVSWQGGTTNIYDQRLQRVLDAAGTVAMRSCAMIETFVANRNLVWGDPTDPQIVLEWIAAVNDRFGSSPNYLRVDGRPVIFVYASSLLQDAAWSDIRARLRASGRDPLLMGEQFESRLIAYFDGEFQYNNVAWPEPYHDLDDAQGLRTRTFHLLLGDRRRVWAASVTPGYDDSRMRDRSTHLTFDRDGGRVYDAMWSAAIDTDADWVVITSWNEWFENTEIEPSERYGTYYAGRTRFWSDQFKGRDQRIRQPFTGPP